MMQNHIRLDDLLARDVALRWFEGVALVQLVCRDILAGSTTGGGFPAPSSIFLGQDGSISIHGIPSADNCVPAAAHILAQMLGDDVPVRLRLLVTQATDAARSPTLAGFSNDLAYFERPDPQQILRQLHERAMLAPAIAVERPRTVEAAAPPENPAAPQPRPGTRTRQAPVVLGLATAALACGAIWLLGAGSADGRAEDAIGRFKDAVRATIGAASPTGPAEPVEKEKETKVTARRAGAGQASGASPVRQLHIERVASGAVTGAASMLPPLARPHDRELLPIRATSWLSDVFYERVEVTASAAPGDGGTIEPDGRRIYSAADVGIVPPRAVYPQLPANPPPGSWLANHTILELVIETDGLVERVRLRTTPRNIHEFMLLSAAKAWQFDPAVREDGLPVRFRHRVALTLP